MRRRHAARSWRCGAAGAAEPGAEAGAAQQAARAGGGEGAEALRRELLATDLNAMLMPELKKVCRRAGLTLKGADLLRCSRVPERVSVQGPGLSCAALCGGSGRLARAACRVCILRVYTESACCVLCCAAKRGHSTSVGKGAR